MDYNTAKKEFLDGNSDVMSWFEQNGYNLEYAYCLFLNGNHDKALNVFEGICSQNIRADWAKKLIQLIKNNNFSIFPTYLQVRNFLEIDLNFLIKFNQIEYAQVILNNAEQFFEICRESYKFIGRTLYYNNFKDLALEFLIQAKSKFYNDAELHYLLGKIYLEKKDSRRALKAIKTCLKLIPNYKPALDILNKLSS